MPGSFHISCKTQTHGNFLCLSLPDTLPVFLSHFVHLTQHCAVIVVYIVNFYICYYTHELNLLSCLFSYTGRAHSRCSWNNDHRHPDTVKTQKPRMAWQLTLDSSLYSSGHTFISGVNRSKTYGLSLLQLCFNHFQFLFGTRHLLWTLT